MKDIRIEKLANNLISYSVDLKENENILIEVIGEDGILLAKELVKKATEVGAKPFVNIINNDLMRVLLENSTKEQLEIWAKHDLNKMKDMDAYIGITAKNNTAEFTDIDSGKMKLYNSIYNSKVHFEERCENTKWCILRYPNNSMAQMSNMPLDKFEDFFFNVCNLDYSKMSKAMDKLVDIMKRTDKVHIKGKDIDLTFSIKGMPVYKYVGNNNIPDGEVATAPIKNSVNGYIKYNTESRQNGILFNNIYFEFKDGKIVKATANNTEEINKLLDTDEGARYIGEFAIGLNPYITKSIGDILFDEKIAGSFHFTPGEEVEENFNGNKSSIHWDIVNIQTPEYGGGEIWFDDILVRKDGKFVIDELKALNPENLI
ncbi:MAG: aminopeptidase [Clostridiales bacterium]|nr:aminopeptidase [Clostridiales bacterium]